MIREEDYYSNPRLEMAPEDYAPIYEEYDYAELEPDPNPEYDDGDDDE